MGQASLNTNDVATRMDRLPVTALHVRALALCALGFTFDTFEIALGSVLSAVFSAPPHTASPQQLSWLLAAMYIGAAVGAPLLGRLADRYGRSRVMVGLLLLLALTSLGAAASENVAALTVFRGLSGLAIGAYPPIVIAYLTDLLPPRRRGMLIFSMVAIATLGPVAAIFLVRWLTPLQPWGIDAWRWGFIVGSLGTAAAAVLFRGLPESPRWLQARGHAAQAELELQKFEHSRVIMNPGAADMTAAPGSETRKDELPVARAHGSRSWPFVAALFFLSPWATVAFPLLTGAILAQKGFRLSDTLLYVGLSFFGPLIGTLLTAMVVDRLERRVTLALCAAAMAGSGLVFVWSSSPSALVASSIAFTLFASIFIPTINVYGAELFPTHSRASQIAGAWALNRVGAAVAPLVLLPLLREGGAVAMFSVIAATLLGSIALLAFAPRGRQQGTVD